MLVNKRCIVKYYGKKVTMQERYKIKFSKWYTGLNDTNNLFTAMRCFFGNVL